MKNGARGYFLKEYGSWSVLIISYLTGLGVSGSFVWEAVPVFFSLALLINSKQAFMKWVRRSAPWESFFIFLAQVILAALILIAVFGREVIILLPLLIFPTAYLLSNRLAGEHHVLTEALGFALLSLAAPLAKFAVVSGFDVRLYVATAVYFIAGVFKVRALLRKRIMDRVLIVLYIAFAAYAYRGFHVSLVILLPLVDNLVVAAALYRVKLKTTGWIEVAKSLLFFFLMVGYY